LDTGWSACFPRVGKTTHTEPCGDTSFNESKEEDETEDDWVTSFDVGFLSVSVCWIGPGRAGVGGSDWDMMYGDHGPLLVQAEAGGQSKTVSQLSDVCS